MSKEFPILPLTLRERCFVARVRLGSFALFDDRYKRLGQQVVGEERKWTLQFVPFLFRLLQSAAFFAALAVSPLYQAETNFYLSPLPAYLGFLLF